MKYIKWQDELAGYLNGLNADERQKVFNYFAEMYADKRDAGLKEEQIIESFGAPYDVAKRILSENGDKQTATPFYKETAAPQTPAPALNQPAQPAPPPVQQVVYVQPAPATANKSAAKAKHSGGYGWKIGLGIFAVLVIIIAAAILSVYLSAKARADRLVFTMKSYTAESQATAIELNIAAGECEVVLYDGDSVVFEYPDSELYGYTADTQSATARLVSDNHRSEWLIRSIALSIYGWNRIPKTVVKLPQNAVYDLNCELAAGEIKIANGTYGDVKLNVSAGKLTASTLECKSCEIDISAGEINLGGVTCEKINCSVSAGDLKIGESACNDLQFDISAGSANVVLKGAQSEYTVVTSVSAGTCNVTPQTGSDPLKKIKADVSAGELKFIFNN